MSVRAFDPSLGRFLSRDPLGRAPLFFADQPYVYGGNNPLINVDPSGQFMADVAPVQAHAMMNATAKRAAQSPRVYRTRGCMRRNSHPTCQQIDNAKASARDAAGILQTTSGRLDFPGILGALVSLIKKGTDFLKSVPSWLPTGILRAGVLLGTAIVAAIVAIKLQIGLASELLYEEADYPDSFWENRSQVNGFALKVGTLFIVLSLAIVGLGLFVALSASNPFTVPVAIGVGLVFAGLVGLMRVFPYVAREFDKQRHILGYAA